MTDWNADLYSRFEAERTRPAKDLLGFIQIDAPQTVVDLGCGPGNSTALLAQRWPTARVTGVDSSPDMLAKARVRLPQCEFIEANIETFAPALPPQVIFSNAALQWLPGHSRLLPTLFNRVASGGVFAIQLPDNLDEPNQIAMREIAAVGPWAKRLSVASDARAILLSPRETADHLGPMAASLDIWRTVYYHPLPDAGSIVTWFLSSGLKPFVDPLPLEEREAFLALYREKIVSAYPPLADGSVLLPFPRLFIVARKR